MTGGIAPVDAPLPPEAGHQGLTTFLLLTAFANGCTAMTGVEAICDGVPAFKEPSAKTAARTLLLMGALAVTMFVGVLKLIACAVGLVMRIVTENGNGVPTDHAGPVENVCVRNCSR